MSIECPYCGNEHGDPEPDCIPHTEDEVWHRQCDSCDKIFGYTAQATYVYTSLRADCQNGGAHDLTKRARYSMLGLRVFYVCKDCDYMREEVAQ